MMNILKNIWIYCLWFVRFAPTITGKTAVVLGVPTHNNIGDIAIAVAEDYYLRCCAGYKKVFMVTIAECWDYSACICRILKHLPFIKVFFQGGGNMGDIYSDEILRRRMIPLLGNKNIFIFPQTIYYTDSENGKNMQQESVDFYNKSNIHIAVREECSLDIVRTLYPKAKYCLSPDIVLCIGQQSFNQARSGILLCFRDDSEQKYTIADIGKLHNNLDVLGYSYRSTSMISQESVISKENWIRVVRQKMEEIASANLLITDRLHGMIFAALTNTPCIVLGNNHHKVFGVYEKWLSHLDYIFFANTMGEAILAIDTLYKKENTLFDMDEMDFEDFQKFFE